jgi:hypothetical protein
MTPDTIQPAKRRKPGRAWPALVLAMLILGYVGVRTIGSTDSIPAGTSDFVAGKGVPYTPPDGAYTVKFPSVPIEQRRTLQAGTVSVPMVLAAIEAPDYELVTGSVVMPRGVAGRDSDVVIKSVLDDVAKAQGLTITSEQHVTHGPASGIEAHVRLQDGYEGRFMFVSDGSRLYMLGAHSVHGAQRLYDALVASFVIT